MFYHLLYPLHTEFSAFNVFRYITLRVAMATLTALIVSLLLGPGLIRRLRQFQIGQAIREEGPQSHRAKQGTPTMGGLLIVTAVVLPTLAWADLLNPFVWIAVASMLLFGAIGFADDYLKVSRRHNLGLTARMKTAAIRPGWREMMSAKAGRSSCVSSPIRAKRSSGNMPPVRSNRYF